MISIQVTSTKALLRFQEALLGIKCRLPLNGDWLFVTADPISLDEKSKDIANEFEDEADVRKYLADKQGASQLDIAKLIYERARAHEMTIDAKADHVRDKAKTLLGTASFVSAVVFWLVSSVLPNLIRGDVWVLLVAFVLSVLLVAHLIRSLYTALRVMIREESVKPSPPQYLGLASANNAKHLIISVARFSPYGLAGGVPDGFRAFE